MSDGGSATPGQNDAPDDGIPTISRRGSSANHAEGVAATELIAKLTGSERLNPVTRHRAAAYTGDDAAATTPIPSPGLNRPSRPDPRAPSRRRNTLVAGRIVAALLAVCALALTGAAWQWQSAKNRLLNTIAALDPNSSDIRDPSGQIGDENFLIVGVDSRIGANSDMGAGDTSVAAGSRSDTIMLVNIPANRKRVVAVSFPRDLAVTPMKCQAWDPETGRYGPVYDREIGEWTDNERLTGTKLNSAYALGGPKCLVKMVQKISGLAINRFMAVDFTGFAKMVDALGGVEVCSTTPLEDAELGTVLATAGRQRIDGPTALNYVRARSIATEGNGDYGRIKRQQLFLSSLLRSMISTDTLFDLGRLDQVVNMFIDDSYVDNIRTRDLVRLGQSLQGINAGRITFVTLPTTGVADYDGNEVSRTEDVRALFDAIIEDDPLPGENDNNETLNPLTTATATSGAQSASATPTSTAESWATATSADEPAPTTTEQVKAVAADPRDVAVQVTASDTVSDPSYLAESATSQLELYRFDVRRPDYYSTSEFGPVTTTTVFYSLGNEQAAATVAATLPGSRIERISGLGETVQVVLGADFTSVKYPQASGTALTVNVTHAGGTTATQLPTDLTVTNGADATCE